VNEISSVDLSVGVKAHAMETLVFAQIRYVCGFQPSVARLCLHKRERYRTAEASSISTENFIIIEKY
jgi:hypothetical protein